jgi:hypothetical protein
MIKAFPKVKDRAAAVISRGVRMSCLIGNTWNLGYTWNFRLGTKRVSASLYSLRPCTKDVSAHHNTHHAALPFKLMKDGSVGRGDAIECPSAETAIVSAEILSRIENSTTKSRSKVDLAFRSGLDSRQLPPAGRPWNFS